MPPQALIMETYEREFEFGRADRVWVLESHWPDGSHSGPPLLAGVFREVAYHL